MITKVVFMESFIEMEAIMEINLFSFSHEDTSEEKKFLNLFYINFMQIKIFHQKY